MPMHQYMQFLQGAIEKWYDACVHTDTRYTFKDHDWDDCKSRESVGHTSLNDCQAEQRGSQCKNPASYVV